MNFFEILGDENPFIGLNDGKNEEGFHSDEESSNENDISRDEGLGSADDSSAEDGDVSEVEDEDYESDSEKIDAGEDTDDFDEIGEGNFEDLALEGDEDEDDSEDEDEAEDVDNPGSEKTDKSVKKMNIPSFTVTSVDSQFLNVRESEWVADNDYIGEEIKDFNFWEEVNDDDEVSL